MNIPRINSRFHHRSAILALFLLGCGSAFAQEFTVAMFRPENIEPAMPARTIQSQPLAGESSHRFWDRENKLLFATAAAGAAADFAVTHANLQNGGRELNPVTRLFTGSTAGLAMNFVGETAGVVGVGYVFHKKGHHKLERLTPLVNFGASAVAVGYGLAHR
jgi:hypothetical protein